MGTMATMVAEGRATGEGPTDPRKREEWLLSHRPYHLEVGPFSIPYKGSYLGTLMGIAANAYETHHGWGEGDDQVVAMSYLHGLQQAMLDDSWLRGVKDMLDAAYHWDEYGKRWVANMATNWMPFSVGQGQVARLPFVDPYARETRGSGVLDQIFKEARAKTPFLSQTLYPRRDLFGEPIPNSGPLQSYKNDPVVQRMDALNFAPSRLEHKIRGIELTDQQYDNYARIAGRTAKVMLNNLVHPGFEMLPKQQQIELIQRMIETGRKIGQDSVIAQSMGSSNDIMRKAIDNKVVKKFGKPETVH
jgi:hypothetical protein